ncbi:MOSC domain-containing protein [Winogradskya humida]|uniref:Molybdenum cofactor biosysynthesis protein n=1 Tax=Winogradskya humida TaxID=113566 RepID=A0ABQ4A2U5_9ACTN|nr:MOSC N-terminal beta barrel domain-containing protein [Actinoplanes humidus]GIE25180.1 molybdenum cofactor biosysynthesis protein [Actinoplanes humidus]
MRIASLHTYPVKGCHRLDHDEAVIEPWGLAGDRRWMIIDTDGVGVTQRQAPLLTQLHAVPWPGGVALNGHLAAEPADGPKITLRVFSSKPAVTARLASEESAAFLSDFLGRPVQLAWLSDPTARPIQNNALPSDRVNFADGFPVLLTNDASLAALDVGVPMTRFRANLVLTGAPAWIEDDWLGGRIRIGDVTFRAAEASGRCMVTTIDQETGVKGGEPLRTLGRLRRVNGRLLFGLNLIPDITPGETKVIRLGDAVLSSA